MALIGACRSSVTVVGGAATTGVGGAAATSSSSGAVVDCASASPLGDREYFYACAFGDAKMAAPSGGMSTLCAGGNCHSSGDYAFLAPEGKEYETTRAWVSPMTGKPFLVKDPASSPLITYPAWDFHAGGVNWKPDDTGYQNHALYQTTLIWLAREAKSLQ